MSETFTRLLSGIVYIGLLLGAIFISEHTFFALILFFGWVSLFELQKLLGFTSYITYGILVASLVFFGYFGIPRYYYLTLVLLFGTLVIDGLLIRDLVSHRKIPLYERQKYLIVIFFLIASFVFLILIPYQNPSKTYNPHILIGVFVLIWSNDTFAYLVGKSIGKRKLFERISPKKTIEGFVGGLVCTCLISYLISRLTGVFSYQIWLGLALVTGIFGTFGDLIQSKLKRQAGVKDSGKIMPGHGGILDRLDSVIFASTFIYAYLVIVNHVS